MTDNVRGYPEISFVDTNTETLTNNLIRAFERFTGRTRRGSSFCGLLTLSFKSGCHPYSAYERGSNENMNRIIRRFFPKGTNFDTITAAEVAQVEEWLANYPAGSWTRKRRKSFLTNT